MAVLREEAFLDSLKIESMPGLAFDVNRPMKHGSSIWPAQASDGTIPTWGFGYPSVRQNGSVTEIYGTCFESPSINNVHLCSPETTDGTTITLPSRGLITFNGNTNNNLITPGAFTRNQFRVAWDEVTQKYVCFAFWNDGSNFHIDIFEATAPKTAGWGSYVKRITAPLGAGVGNAQSCEPTALFRRADGRWFMFIQTSQPGTADYGGSRRHVGALLGPSDGSLTGTWTNLGDGLPYNAILQSPSGSEQYYHAGGWVDGELVYVPIGIFDGSAAPPAGHSLANFPVNCIHKVQLFVGRASDPTVLTLVDSAWVSATGIEGDFDGGEIIGANNVAEVGNVWRYYFGTDKDTHHQTPELTRELSFGDVGKRRVGQVSGTGPVTLTTISDPAGSHFSLNSVGNVQVELLDPGGSLIAGYSLSDCDPIPANTYEHVVTWNGRAATPAAYNPKIHLTSATCHFAKAITRPRDVPVVMRSWAGASR